MKIHLIESARLHIKKDYDPSFVRVIHFYFDPFFLFSIP